MLANFTHIMFGSTYTCSVQTNTTTTNAHFSQTKAPIHHWLRIVLPSFLTFKPIISSGFPGPESALVHIRREIAFDVKQEKKIYKRENWLGNNRVYALKGWFLFRVSMNITADHKEEDDR